MLVAATSWATAVQPASAADDIESQYAQPGPHGVATADVTDASGNVVYEIYYPSDLATGCDRHPLITWGNGSFAVPSQYPGVLNQLASWGFVVIASTDTTVGTGAEMLAAAEHMVAENGRLESPFFAKIDVDNVGAVGHSQGAGGAINAANLSEGLITSVMPIALPNRIWVGPGDEFDPAALEAPVFFMSGVFDFFVSSQATNTGFYNEVSGPAAKAALTGAGHNTIQGEGGGFLGYLTTWFMYTLRGDVAASGAFVGSPAEIATNARWRNQAVKNLAEPDGVDAPSCPELWSPSVTHDRGETVLHQGKVYEASSRSSHEAPGDPWGPWQEVATGPGEVAFWTPSRIFDTGDVTVYEGRTFRTLWWTRNQAPGEPWGPWEEIETAPDGTVIWTPSRLFTAGDRAIHDGQLWEAHWTTRNHAPGDAPGPWTPAPDQT